MKSLPLKAILVSETRQRRNFDLKSLSDLAESIKRVGLMHAIVLREEVDGWHLVAGERRLRAIADIWELGESFTYEGAPVPHGEIPYINLGELDDLAREEAELDENIKRVDLSWQERASATAHLASLRARQSAAQGTPPPPVAEIAVEVRGSAEGVNQETTRREIIVAKHLADPEVKGAKDVNEAFKILKRKEETQRRVELAATVGRTYSAETAHTALHEDSLAWMAKCAGELFSVILTDLPYGINADEFGDSGGKAAGAHFYEDSYDNWKRIAQTLAKEGFRITKPQAHLYAFCDITRFEEFKAILADEGWQCFRTPIIWVKPNGSRTPWVDFGPQRKYEIVLYANKGKKPVTRIYGDVIICPTDENLGHPAQKPVAVFEDLLRRSITPGDKVLDPFAGSGPIFPAAQELKLFATGIEQDAAAYGLCLKRLDQLKESPELEGL